MSNQASYQPNPETRATAPLQVFESDANAPPAGTKATPRPAGRPRELPPDNPSSAFQFFEGEVPSAGD